MDQMQLALWTRAPTAAKDTTQMMPRPTTDAQLTTTLPDADATKPNAKPDHSPTDTNTTSTPLVAKPDRAPNVPNTLQVIPVKTSMARTLMVLGPTILSTLAPIVPTYSIPCTPIIQLTHTDIDQMQPQ